MINHMQIPRTSQHLFICLTLLKYQRPGNDPELQTNEKVDVMKTDDRAIVWD